MYHRLTTFFGGTYQITLGTILVMGSGLTKQSSEATSICYIQINIQEDHIEHSS